MAVQVQLCPRVPINKLPDEVLLIIFEIYMAYPVRVPSDEEACHQMLSVTDVTLLNRHGRVCKIVINNIPNSFLKGLVSMSSPFPALITLDLTSFEHGPQILHDSFLGGSVPSLRSFSLWGIQFPAMGKLLLSTHDLVKLSLGFFHLPDLFHPRRWSTSCLH